VALLWRSNPRRIRGTWAGQLTQQRPATASGAIATDNFFGIFATLESGQGSATSDIVASISTPAVTITTGQGSATSDLVADVASFATLETAQGSATSDGVAHVPFIATIETGQGSATSDGSFDVVDFQAIRPPGFWDSANETVYTVPSLWRLNPRTQRFSLASLLAQQEVSQALASVAATAQFAETTRSYFADGIGTHSVSTDTQYAIPLGIDLGTIGVATVYNSAQVIAASGSAFQAFGTATVYNLAQVLAPTGVDSGEDFGTAAVTHYTRYVGPFGISEDQFGVAYVHDLTQGIAATGAQWTAFGTAAVQNQDRFVLAQRIDPGSFGTPTMIGPRYITASAGDTSLFGLPDIIGPRTSLIQGFNAALYGAHWVSNGTRTVYANDIEIPYLQVSPGAFVNDFTQYVSAGSIDEPEFFGPVTGIAPFDVLEASGFDDSAIGDATVSPGAADRILYPRSLSSYAIGSARISPAAITGIGFAASSFGVARVSNYTRYLAPAGISVVRYGTNWISNYIRYIDPAGFDRSVVWDDFGPVDENGRAARVYLADPTITVLGAGIDSGAFGTPSVRQDYGC